jgi:hypothetical protein
VSANREEVLCKVKQLLLILADNGTCPAQKVYDANRGDLPSAGTLRLRMGTSLNRLAVEAGLSPRLVGVGTGQASSSLMWQNTTRSLNEADRLSVTDEPPDELPAKLRWSTGGLMAMAIYQNQRGETCYVLR